MNDTLIFVMGTLIFSIFIAGVWIYMRVGWEHYANHPDGPSSQPQKDPTWVESF